MCSRQVVVFCPYEEQLNDSLLIMKDFLQDLFFGILLVLNKSI